MAATPGAVYAIATMDTKGQELQFVADCLRDAGVEVRMVDVSTAAEPTIAADVSRSSIYPKPIGELPTDRGDAIAQMADGLAQFLVDEYQRGKVLGVIGIGGSGGTSLITTAMRALPIGLPKLMVSTVASGNTAPYVDCSDIAMLFSVVDVAGLNVVSRRVLSNAAYAIAGMAQAPDPVDPKQKTLGLTMFGVTTPCVTQVREILELEGYDCLVFHATGTGGRAMEKLVESGMIRGVLDLTTTEVADEIVGGVFPAGPARFDRLVEAKIPLLLSFGAVDMVNFGSKDSVPHGFQDRLLHVHNAQVTLMRTTPDENRRIAHWIASKLNRSTAPVTVLFPEGGVSMLDAPGQPFHDPDAREALWEAFHEAFIETDNRRLLKLPHHINDPAFARIAVEQFESLLTSTLDH